MSLLPEEEWSKKLAKSLGYQGPFKPFGTERTLSPSKSKLSSIAQMSDTI